ncbi:hypothetical protein Desaci_0186 [Desulfosporosinus acidiphilus SJ4]|uniref:Bacterial Pleckstrin homology domain-containing protein n=2 Tax=Desulfosporosinus TaxID=79206 RepID=I4D0D9_DESAJ|nr:hypothetical protein Desaci_0186 [Desulfosporosinus acidiphilus SJ4]
MNYHLSIIDVLKAWFFPINLMSILVTIIIILASINASKKAYRDRGTPMFLKSIIIFLALIAIPVFLVGSEYGSGWQLQGEELLLKAPPSNSSINLKSTRIALLSGSISSQWTPESRTMGVGIAGLGTGSFTLKNGKNAVVFSYLPVTRVWRHFLPVLDVARL